jgi:hypothetical protein
VKRIVPPWVLALGVVLGLSQSSAWAQYSPYSPYSPYGGGYGPTRPQLSPYLNLLRGGNPAANYYGGVLPERQRRAQAGQFSAEIQDLERRGAAGAEREDQEAPRLGETGHYVQFLNTSPYYPYSPYAVGAPGAGAGTRPPATGRRR